jgi:hypothetical protein
MAEVQWIWQSCSCWCKVVRGKCHKRNFSS